MRTIVLGILALTICSLSVIARPLPNDPKPAEPTEEQLSAAKEAFAKFGARYLHSSEPTAKRASQILIMPNKTTNQDLKTLPNLPFHFVLILCQSKVTRVHASNLRLFDIRR
jgi:hypothetical protein